MGKSTVCFRHQTSSCRDGACPVSTTRLKKQLVYETDSILIYHLPRPLYGLLLPEGIGHSSSGGDNHGADDSESLLRNSLQRLYLKPLVARIQANGGKVYPGSDRPFYLMVDCKAQGEEMYKLLKKQMEPYKEYFCSVDNGEYKEGAVLFFLSGDRPKNSLPKENSRFTFLDGQIKDLGQGIPASLAPVISDNYSDFFTWKGEGEMPADQLQKMREIIRKVHDEGKLFRWWGAPDTEQFKRFFIKEGVDLVGADDLNGLYNVLNER